MAYYQAPSGKIYYFQPSVTNAETYLPAGSTLITDEQVLTLLGTSPLQEAKTKRIYGYQSPTGKVPGLQQDYAAANAVDIEFTTAGGITKDFQADPGSVKVIQESLAGCSLTQATPDGFFWVSSDNTQVSPFTYADLQGLAATVFARGAANFARLQVAKAAVAAATTVEEVNAATF